MCFVSQDQYPYLINDLVNPNRHVTRLTPHMTHPPARACPKAADLHRLIRVRPDIPMLYQSESWDFGWLMLRTDGKVVYRRCDPYSLAFDDRELQHSIRWFTR